MPSKRRRIGYLPSNDVQEIIDKLSKENNFSQSKVTGILVEEALRSRGVIPNLNNYSNNKSKMKDLKDKNSIPINTDLNNTFNNNTFDNNRFNEDLKLINEFIDFKFFKKILLQNKKFFD